MVIVSSSKYIYNNIHYPVKRERKKAFLNHALCHIIVACHQKIVAPAQKRVTAQYLTVCMAVEILRRNICRHNLGVTILAVTILAVTIPIESLGRKSAISWLSQFRDTKNTMPHTNSLRGSLLYKLFVTVDYFILL